MNPILISLLLSARPDIYYIPPALDLVSTEIGLSQGMREGNPILKNRSVRISTKLILASALMEYDRREQKKGRKPKTIRIIWIIGNAAVIGWNLKKLKDNK